MVKKKTAQGAPIIVYALVVEGRVRRQDNRRVMSPSEVFNPPADHGNGMSHAESQPESILNSLRGWVLRLLLTMSPQE